jgi:membrane-associated PAP2 superfamily phosphatase
MIEALFANPFWKSHLLRPMLAFFSLIIVFEISSIDIWIADALYHVSGNTWLFRNSWITEQLVYKNGWIFIGILAILLVALIFSSFWIGRMRQYRRGLLYVLTSVVVSGVLINFLKEVTHVECPWDLLRYGGEYEYIRNFDWQFGYTPHGTCFPSGHAGAAWAWFGLYYFTHEYAKPWRFPSVLGVLVLGTIFGFSQELRGAHFLSHDIWTLGLCWLIASLLYMAFFGLGNDKGAVVK